MVVCGLQVVELLLELGGILVEVWWKPSVVGFLFGFHQGMFGCGYECDGYGADVVTVRG